tara:strand:+ start:4613 stop:5287 length:675 start_codon:yes stop_codon:yes gene_type:complete
MALTQGHAIICCDRNRRGGLKRIWLMEKDNLGLPVYAVATDGYFTSPATAGTAAGGEYKSLPGTKWYEFEFDRGTAGFNANATRENGSTLVNIELEFYIPKITEEINGRLRELTESCGLVVLVESYADDCDAEDPETYFFLLGYDKVFESTAYLEFSSGEQSTGVGLQDANGTLVKLAGIHAEYPREVLVKLSSTNAAQSSAASDDWIDMFQPATGTTKAWTTD